MTDWARLRTTSQEIFGELAPRNPLTSVWAKNLAGLADALSHKIRVDGQRPTRAELRREIAGLSEAIGILEAALQNVTLLEVLHPHMEEGIAQIGPAMVTLRRYRAAADAALPTISTTAGPGKAKVADNLLDARAWCAMLIREAWNLARGELPGGTNEIALDMAERLWCAVTNEQQADSLDKWKRPFERARQCDDWQLQHVRKHMDLRPLDFSVVRSET